MAKFNNGSAQEFKLSSIVMNQAQIIVWTMRRRGPKWVYIKELEPSEAKMMQC